MAHIQTAHLKLWKPEDLAVDKISSQKMFIDNINAIEEFAKTTMQKMHRPVQSLNNLRAIDTSDTSIFTTGMLIMVNENGMYYFNRNHYADDDNNAIIKPTTGGGRWITTQVTDIAMGLRQISNDNELDTILTNMLINMSDNSVKFAVIKTASGTVPPFYGGTVHMMIHKVNNLYAMITSIIYNSDRVARQFTRVRYDGIWGRWTMLPFLDDNYKIPLDQLPSVVLPASIE